MFRTNKAHPWHGIPIGEKVPQEVTVFIEIVPRDTVKYEVDKETGYLKIDRPQQYSNVVPANYGFIPQTYCGENIAKLASTNSGRTIELGDGDPLDILVLSEHHIPRGDIILKAKPIGGFCLIDGGEADDKIIATLVGDKIYENFADISELPEAIVKRLEHYFLTYKSLPSEENICEIAYVYGRDKAYKVIEEAIKDYEELKNKSE
jgi:inorganic pyrophosphatase